MKRSILLLLFLAFLMMGKPQFTYFNEIYNENVWSAALSILETDSGYITCGVSGKISGEYIFKRIVLMTIDKEGNPDWWKTYGEDFHNYYAGGRRGFIKTSDGGYALSGSIEDTIRNIGLLMKFDSNGDSLWACIYGDTISPGYSSLIFIVCKQLPDNGFIITGEKYISGTDGDVILIRTDSLGNEIWNKHYGIPHWGEKGFSIALLPDGEFLIGIVKQYIGTNNTSRDAGLLKVDSFGNLIWMKFYGGPFNDGAARVQLAQDGNYIFGSTYAFEEPLPGYPGHKAWVVKTDTTGEIIWEKKYGDTLFLGWCSTLDILENGDLLLSGNGSFYDSPGSRGWVLKTESNGDSIWFRRYTYFPGELNHLNDLQTTIDSGIIITGTTASPVVPPLSIWIQKLDSIGCDTAGCDPTVWIPQITHQEKREFNIFPNPASNTLTFRYNSTDEKPEEIIIFNTYGILVKKIRIPDRQNQHTIDISSYPSGLYIAVLRNERKIIAKGKFIIAR